MYRAIIFRLDGGQPGAFAPLSALLAAAGMVLHRTVLLPAERCPLEAALRRAASEADTALILTVGAAGAASCDIAPDALAAVLTRPLPGMSAALRSTLPESKSQLFRGQAGMRGTVLLANLPSFPETEAALTAILPAVKAYLEK